VIYANEERLGRVNIPLSKLLHPPFEELALKSAAGLGEQVFMTVLAVHVRSRGFHECDMAKDGTLEVEGLRVVYGCVDVPPAEPPPQPS
jgi:hypothetical protein